MLVFYGLFSCCKNLHWYDVALKFSLSLQKIPIYVVAYILKVKSYNQWYLDPTPKIMKVDDKYL